MLVTDCIGNPLKIGMIVRTLGGQKKDIFKIEFIGEGGLLTLQAIGPVYFNIRRRRNSNNVRRLRIEELI